MDHRKIITKIATYFETPLPQVKKVAWNTFGYATAEGKITGLGFYAQPLASFPQEVLNLDSLEVLSLTGGGLTALPPEIGGLANLRELYIGGNEIKAIPKEIGGLQKLEVLYILEDQLEGLPETLADLKQLQEFSVSSKVMGQMGWWINKLKGRGCRIYFNNKEQ